MIPSRLRFGSGADVVLEGSTGDIQLDGGKFYPDKDDADTYIWTDAADKLIFEVGDAAMMTFVEDTTDKITLSNACDFYIDDGKLFFAADDADTYMISSAADTLSVFVGGVEMIKCTESTADDVTILGTLYVQDQIVGIPLENCRTSAAMITPLPAAGDGTSPGLVDSIAALMKLVTTAANNNSKTETFGVMAALPPTYKAGQTVKLRIRGGVGAVLTAAATVDVNAYVLGDDDAISADLCTTEAQSINSTTFANKDFTINDAATGEALGPGDVLQFKVTMVANDTGGAVNDSAIINELKLIISA